MQVTANGHLDEVQELGKLNSSTSGSTGGHVEVLQVSSALQDRQFGMTG
jgi:hypothetical protein